MTVAISHSRFKAVENPIVHRNLLITKRARAKYLLRYIFSILAISIAFTVPSFWEYEVKHYEDETVLEPTNFRLHPYYTIFYVAILSIGIVGIVPLVSIVYFNK